ncbi:MAG: hypothetical protein C0597_03535 [Marinilabiliales bacterium]|nr:MAG: hypothetical protein C0597_03535 [Marinilabiliales bacterium]
MKIGLIGINNLSQEEHFKNISQALQKKLHGIFSHSDEILPISSSYNVKIYKSTGDLFDHVDAVYFANSLKPNFDFALNALKKSCHLFVEDVSELKIEEMKHLYKVAFEARSKMQLKLTKMFSPEFIEVRDSLTKPKLIEINRSFSKLMRFDDYFTEILNSLYFSYKNMRSSVKKYSTQALPLDNNHFSLVHLRLEYDNGAIVNIKFSNISTENSSNLYFYENDRVIYINFDDHYANKVQFLEGQITRREFNIPKENAFHTEMDHFINSCQNLDFQNLTESPTILKIIQLSHEIKEKLIHSSQPF